MVENQNHRAPLAVDARCTRADPASSRPPHLRSRTWLRNPLPSLLYPPPYPHPFLFCLHLLFSFLLYYPLHFILPFPPLSPPLLSHPLPVYLSLALPPSSVLHPPPFLFFLPISHHFTPPLSLSPPSPFSSSLFSLPSSFFSFFPLLHRTSLLPSLHKCPAFSLPLNPPLFLSLSYFPLCYPPSSSLSRSVHFSTSPYFAAYPPLGAPLFFWIRLVLGPFVPLAAECGFAKPAPGRCGGFRNCSAIFSGVFSREGHAEVCRPGGEASPVLGGRGPKASPGCSLVVAVACEDEFRRGRRVSSFRPLCRDETRPRGCRDVDARLVLNRPGCVA